MQLQLTANAARLPVGTLVSVHGKSPAEDRVFRLIRVAPGADQVCWIDVDAAYTSPRRTRLSDLQQMLASGRASVCAKDPKQTAALTRKRSAAGEKFLQDWWPAIRDAVAPEAIGKLCSPHTYRQAIRDIVACHADVSESKVRRLIVRYLQGGMVPAAILPDWDRCGAPGTPRAPVKRNGATMKKPGAHRQILGVSPGIVMDAETQAKVIGMIQTKYLRSRNPPHRKSVCLSIIHDLSPHATYSMAGQALIGSREECYSVRQIDYLMRYIGTPEEVVRRRAGQRAVDLGMRARTDGDPGLQPASPGAMYSTDSTTLNVRTVLPEKFRKKGIDRLTIYEVKDEHTRLIVGWSFCVAPSLDAQLEALHCAFMPKRALFAAYGVPLDPGDPDPCGVPNCLLADRGEASFKAVEPVIEGLGMTVKNAPVHRPDRKGKIESEMGSVNRDMANTDQPGMVLRDEFAWPTKDAEATLSVRETIRTYLEHVRLHNHTTVQTYALSAEEMADGAPTVPVERWDYSSKTMGCALLPKDGDALRVTLLRPRTASVTVEGILWHGVTYVPDRGMTASSTDPGVLAEAQEILALSKRAAIKKHQEVRAYVDPMAVEVIRVQRAKGTPLVPCRPRQGNLLRAGTSLLELEDIQLAERGRKAREEGRHCAIRNDAMDTMVAIGRDARKRRSAESAPNQAGASAKTNPRKKAQELPANPRAMHDKSKPIRDAIRRSREDT